MREQRGDVEPRGTICSRSRKAEKWQRHGRGHRGSQRKIGQLRLAIRTAFRVGHRTLAVSHFAVLHRRAHRAHGLATATRIGE